MVATIVFTCSQGQHTHSARTYSAPLGGPSFDEVMIYFILSPLGNTIAWTLAQAFDAKFKQDLK